VDYANEAHQVLIPNGFQVDHKVTKTHYQRRPHYHDGCEINFCMHDNTDVYVDDKHYHVNSGTITVFNSQEIHRVFVERGVDYERYYLLFKPEFIEFALSEYPDLLMIFYRRPKHFVNCLTLCPSDQRRVTELLNDLVFIYAESETPLHGIKLRQKFIELLIFLDERYSQYANISPKQNTIRNELLTSVSKYVKANIDADLTLDNIAEHFYTSKSTLIRTFKTHMGLTPYEFITYTRIMYSRDLVLQGLSIREVAFRVGYKDESSFIRKFKELQGLSPKQYLLTSRH
jgi:AraC-like DNA-binding protein